MSKQDSQISTRETETILLKLASLSEVDGDVVEFGCYAGDTSVLLAEQIRGMDKWLWLYDSFEGLPAKTVEDKSNDGWAFKPGELKANPETVKHKFKKMGLPEPVIIKGWFNAIDKDNELPAKISFALLDGDYYESIKTSLNLVAPKLVKGGVIAVHDYRNSALPGVAKAVNEFLEIKRKFSFQFESGIAFLKKA